MGLVLSLIAIAALISFLVYWGCELGLDHLRGWFIAGCLASLGTCCVIWGHSYTTYLETRTFYDATREQYANAVEMYKDYAVLDLEGAAAVAFTDFKYQGYQENMAQFISLLRDKVIAYNKRIISKRLMKETFFFSWMIFAPDRDMKIIKMTSAGKGLEAEKREANHAGPHACKGHYLWGNVDAPSVSEEQRETLGLE